MKSKNIYILYGGEKSEREVSLRTGKAMFDALSGLSYENLTLFDVVKENIDEIVSVRPDICLIAIHGRYGEDGQLQARLDELKIKYTGSGVVASALAFDKYLTKLCLATANVPTPEYWLSKDLTNSEDAVPCVVKPVAEGSSVGISIVKKADEYKAAVELAEKYDKWVLVERFIDGKELTVGIVDGRALPPVLIKPKSGLYDYESKYTAGATEYLFDTGLTDDEIRLVQKVALKTYDVIGCSGVARVDIMYDGSPYVLEVNTVPGMTETSLLPMGAKAAGMDFAALVEYILIDGFNTDREL